MSTATIPVTIAPEAAERVAELGMGRELERMLDYLRGEVRGVLSIDVQLALPYDTGDDAGISFDVLLDCPWSDLGPRRAIRDWMVHTFPPHVNRYFAALTVPAPLPGGESLLPKEAMRATGVAVTIDAEADQRVAELGMQRELRRMLEHALQTIPGLRAVAVKLWLPYDTGEEPGITIEATGDSSEPSSVRSEWEWAQWKGEAFPPDVGRYFSLLLM